MQRRIDKIHLPAADASAATTKPVIKSVRSERSEMEQANILYSLIENRYIKKVRIHKTCCGQFENYRLTGEIVSNQGHTYDSNE